MDNGSYRRFLDGDREAFDEIMEGLFGSLVFFINRYVGDYHAAEDIAMDAMADLIVHPHRFNFQVSLKTYVFMIGRSRALDYMRHRKIIPFVELSQVENMAGDGGDLEEMLLSDGRKRALHNALEKLPPDLKEAVYLVYFEDLSYAEAAKVMKRTKKQIDNLLYRGKTALRKLLKEESL